MIPLLLQSHAEQSKRLQFGHVAAIYYNNKQITCCVRACHISRHLTIRCFPPESFTSSVRRAQRIVRDVKCRCCVDDSNTLLCLSPQIRGTALRQHHQKMIRSASPVASLHRLPLVIFHGFQALLIIYGSNHRHDSDIC